MKTGRPAIQRESVRNWLRNILAKGPVLIDEIKQWNPASWRTLETVKRELGIRSKSIDGKWSWYLGSASGRTPHTSGEACVPVLPEPDTADSAIPDYEEPLYTAQMLKSIRVMHLVRHESESRIASVLINDSRRYPTEPPYPESYIRELVHSVIYDKPKPAIPEGIEELF
jgi:hypothetical protein